MARQGTERQGQDLISAFQNFEQLWLEPCGCCGVTFPARNAAMAAQWWITLVDRGDITGENLQEVFEGLARYRASDSWHKDGGQWVPGMDKFLGYSKNGLPAAPLWKDRPTPYLARKAVGKY